MSIWTKIGGALSLKALREVRLPGQSLLLLDHGHATVSEMRRDIGNGSGADVIMSPVRWLQRAFAEAPLVVRDEEGAVIDNHPLSALVRQPNPFYTADYLFAGTVYSLVLTGNAYWLCVRNGAGEIVELWWTPSTAIEPRWPETGSEFITHYDYRVQGRTMRLEPEDVIHFRDGVDPANIRKGLSPLRGLLREIWTDQEAAAYTAALLRNGGVPGLIVSPRNADGTISGDEAERIKLRIDSSTTREQRGRTLVLGGAVVVEQFGFSPQQLDLGPLRDISEERVTAALGVPAAVVGFGSGLQQTKVGATMKELRQLAWYNGVMPLQRIVSSQIQHKLGSIFDAPSVEFNTDDVIALQEDETARVQRITQLVGVGLWTRGEARAETGQEVMDADDVFLQPINLIEVPRSGRAPVADEERSAGAPQQVKDDHTGLERTVSGRQARRPTPAILRFAEQLDTIRRELSVAMENDLLGFFNDLGDLVERATADVLTGERSVGGMEIKQDATDAQRIADGLDLLGREQAFAATFERHYLRVAGEVAKGIRGLIGLAVGIPDPVARSIMATGGTRAGLVDLTAQVRRSILDGLVDGRIDGLAGDNLARRIRGRVEAGPWSSAKIRARVIARTETAFATNVSTVEMARSIDGVEQAMILDARVGPTDAVCEALNGQIVTLDEARQLAADEHPNGTRSFTPLTLQLVEELT